MAAGRDHRPRGLGPRPRGKVPRPAGHRVLPRGRRRAGRVARGRFVARPCSLPGRRQAGRRRARRSDLRAGRAASRAAARQAALRARLGQLGTTMPIYAGTFSQPGPTHVLRRGDPMQPGDQVSPSAVAAVGTPLCAAGRHARARSPARPGPVDRRRRQSAAGAGDGQPGLALPFRPGHRRHAQRFRLQRRPSLAPGAARLAGLAVHGRRLAAQAAAPADPALGHLSPVEPARCARRWPSTSKTACSGG